jgi:dihydroorotate dehydrogenase electron transfer subunit
VIRRVLAPVLRNTPLAAPGHYVLEFAAPDLAREAQPGQFIAVAGEAGQQLLRRPFSVFTADPVTGSASILFSVYGPTTRAMAECGPGDLIDLIGPLGGRVFAADARPGVHHIMIGGGYGVPPLVFLARRILASDAGARVTFINGARTKAFLVGTEEIEEEGVPVLSCTDDGTCGIHGRVTVGLENVLGESGGPFHLYTCGPTPMMKAVGEIAIWRDLPCQVSMETFMPCGIGICMGCAVPRPDGTYARGCTDGPVFDAREIVW